MSNKEISKSSAGTNGVKIPKLKNGKSVRELKDKHMKDKNNVITDEDIRNLDLDMQNPDRTTSHTPDLPDTSKRPKDEDKDPERMTPWDVIGE